MNLRALNACAMIMSLAFLAACGGGGGGPRQDPQQPQNQTIAFATPGAVTGSVGSSITNVASGGAGTGAITYASGNASVATINATTGVATLVAVGTATITATKAASNGFNSATATYTLNVSPGTQTITFALGGPLNVLLDTVTNNAATGGAGTGPITYASSNTAAIRVDAAGAATAVGVGSATITAVKAADANYNQAETTYAVNVQTADTVSAWIGAGGSTVFMPASANGKQFGRARVSDCTPPDSVVTCTNASLSDVNGAAQNDTAATLTTPAYYAIFDGTNLGAPVVVNSNRFAERIGHASVFFAGRYWVIGGGRPLMPDAVPPVDHSRESDVWSSFDGRSWKLETASAAFGARWFHKVLVFGNQMFVLGGARADGSGVNEVWRSADGINWLQSAGLPIVGSPIQQAATVFSNEMWIVFNGRAYSSPDGLSWTVRTAPADAIDAGVPREYATLTAYGGALWYMAGARVVGNLRNAVSDVWRSTDGATWTPVNVNAFSPRYQHAAFVLNDRLWAFGGRPVVNSVDGAASANAFSTTDGVTWTPESTTSEIDRSFLLQTVQEDDRVTVVGGILRAYSDKTWQTTDGNNWTELAAVQHSPRLLSSALSFNGFMWLIGGGSLDKLDTNEVWRSADGLNWTQVAQGATTFSPRSSHASVVFNNRMWILGGWNFFEADGATPTTFNDVWSSADGANWTSHAGPFTRFPARALHDAVVFNGRIWVIGGNGGNSGPARMSDVWSSADGANWTQETASAAFPARYGHKVAALNNALLLFAGSTTANGNFALGSDDIWRSENGRDWIQLSPGPRFQARSEHAIAVLGNRVYLTTGFNSNDYNAGTRFNDVWSTADGVNWLSEAAAPPFRGRNAASLITHNGELYLLGGFGISRQHNIWRSNDGGKSWRLGFSNPMSAP
jgi:hypothetical protein